MTDSAGKRDRHSPSSIRIVMALAVVCILGAGGWLARRSWLIKHDPLAVLGGVQLVYEIGSWDRSDALPRETDVARTVATVRRRFLDAVPLGRFKAEGTRLELLVPAPDARDHRLDELKDIIGQSGKIEFKIVDDSSTIMEELARRWKQAADVDPTIEVATGRWGGTPGHDETFFTGANRGKLEAALAQLTRDAPLDDDHQLGFEVLEAPGGRHWRTYLLFKRAEIANQDIGDVVLDSTPGLSRLNITLRPEGAQRFAVATEHAVGRRLAVLYQSRVSTVQMIESKQPEGRVSLTLGGASPQELEALLSALCTGALAAPLKKVEERRIGAI
jgi:preprotein translocase subunit SecD